MTENQWNHQSQYKSVTNPSKSWTVPIHDYREVMIRMANNPRFLAAHSHMAPFFKRTNFQHLLTIISHTNNIYILWFSLLNPTSPSNTTQSICFTNNNDPLFRDPSIFYSHVPDENFIRCMHCVINEFVMHGSI